MREARRTGRHRLVLRHRGAQNGMFCGRVIWRTERLFHLDHSFTTNFHSCPPRPSHSPSTLALLDPSTRTPLHLLAHPTSVHFAPSILVRPRSPTSQRGPRLPRTPVRASLQALTSPPMSYLPNFIVYPIAQLPQRTRQALHLQAALSIIP